jgi:hypothetical protein
MSRNSATLSACSNSQASLISSASTNHQDMEAFHDDENTPILANTPKDDYYSCSGDK